MVVPTEEEMTAKRILADRPFYQTDLLCLIELNDCCRVVILFLDGNDNIVTAVPVQRLPWDVQSVKGQEKKKKETGLSGVAVSQIVAVG